MTLDLFSMPAPVCKIDGCSKSIHQCGMCSTHYSRWHRHGDPLKRGKELAVYEGPKRADLIPGICLIEECSNPVKGAGLCNKHLLRWRNNGDPRKGRDIAAKGGTLLGCGKAQCPAARKLWGHMDYLAKTDLYKSRAKINYWADEERSRQVAREYAATHRQEALDRTKEWKTTNPERYRANNARNLAAYREYIRQATPPWVDLAAIDAVYMAAPKGSHVDHIVPIRGDNVCGLHVHWNMQYLPESENCSKGNTFTEADGIDYTAPAWRVMA